MITLESLADMTLETARRVAWGREPVRLGARADAAMAAARERFLRLIDDPDIVVYGVTSGYGQRAKIRLSGPERRAHAARPPAPPAAAWGEPLPDRAARAIVFARLANFVEGHAAASPAVGHGVAAMLDGAPLPDVPAAGQGGAGEILSLSPLFLPLSRQLDLAEKDALSLVNGSPSATGLLVDATLAAERRLELAGEALTLAIEAFHAPLTHYDAALEAAWANPHDAWALAALRRLLGPTPGQPRRPYQAPVSFRIAPRILGQARAAFVAAQTTAAEALRAVTDNPLTLAPSPEHPNGAAISTGGYHNAQAPAAMDALTAASANLLILLTRMADKILDPAVSLRGGELGDGETAPYLGCLPMAMVGFEEEARRLATATLLPGSEAGGFGQNDIASPVFAAWSKQERAGLLLERGIAALAVICAQALAADGRAAPSPVEALAALGRSALARTPPGGAPGPEAERVATALRERVFAASSASRSE